MHHNLKARNLKLTLLSLKRLIHRSSRVSTSILIPISEKPVYELDWTKHVDKDHARQLTSVVLIDERGLY